MPAAPHFLAVLTSSGLKYELEKLDLPWVFFHVFLGVASDMQECRSGVLGWERLLYREAPAVGVISHSALI